MSTLSPSFAIAALALAFPATGQVVVTEYVSSNVESRIEVDGTSPDWIELWNSGSATVNLAGWGLSDDASDPFQWTFPDYFLGPNEYVVAFASGRDKRVTHNEYHTLITEGDDWRYAPGLAEPPPDWFAVNFNDSGFRLGASGFGYGDQDDNTWVNTSSVYLRKTFQLPANFADGITMAFLHIDIDDGFVAYLNGEEIARSNMGRPGDHPPFDQLAETSVEAHLYRGWGLHGLALEDFRDRFQPGKNVLAIQAHNANASGSDLTAIPMLSVGTTKRNPTSNAHPGLLFEQPALHTNFKLDSLGDTIVLTQPDGTVVDNIATGPMYVDVSRGRHPHGLPGQWYFAYATPGAANTDGAEVGFSSDVTMTPAAGELVSGESITLGHAQPTAEIRYTLDGSEPTETSPLYTGAITRGGVFQIVRARAFEANLWPSWITSQSYFGNVPSDLPTVSLITDPDHLWDPNLGIYENFSEDWERPAHVELFEPDGSLRFSQDIGLRIHGGLSRIWAQKSFRLMGRGGYREPEMNGRMFHTEGIDSFKRLLLRNGGTDNNRGHLRDGLASRIIAGEDLESAAFRPAALVLNGEYWGVQNLRERIDKYHLAYHRGADPDNMDLLETAGRFGAQTRMKVNAIEGDTVHWEGMIDFLLRNPLSNPANYDHFQTLVDVDNYATYLITEIYLANRDWPHHNSKMWRPRTPDGRWRWLLYDVDNGMQDAADALDNTLRFAIGEDTPNGHVNFSFVLREMLKNLEFRNRFINRYADYLNTRFTTARTLAELDRAEMELDPEMRRHKGRWGGQYYKWKNELDNIRDFFDIRPGRATQHLRAEFQLPAPYELILDVSPAGAGYLDLTAIQVTESFTGLYFPTVPVEITAIPAEGYVFDSWSDPLLPATPSVSVDSTTAYSLTANFLPVGPSVVINEINYKSADDFDPGDWVELYNNSDQAIDLSNWEFRDDNNNFELPTGTILAARSYLVLCQDLHAFQALFPNVSNAIGDLGFGLSSNGEQLQLRDSSGMVRDQVEYHFQPPWPTSANGLGPTLELLRPALPNDLGRNWRTRVPNSIDPEHGTPGSANSPQH
jgi:hypothetical protein